MKERKEKNRTYFKAIECKVIAQNEEFIAISIENIQNLKDKSFVIEGAYDLFSKMIGE